MADPRPSKNPQSGQWSPSQKEGGNFAGQEAGQQNKGQPSPQSPDPDKNKIPPGRTEGTKADGMDDEDFKTPAGESKMPDRGDSTRQTDQKPL
jgi:hypothetical protein